MKILLDTSTFLWAVAGDARLSKAAESTFMEAETLYLSSISAWEIAMKYHLGKLDLISDPASYIPRQRDIYRIGALAFEEPDTYQLAKLPLIHKDPFDRMLIAQAIAHNLTILTCDRAITQYPVATFW